jgi:biopolymer transport protein TolQ
MAIPATAVAPVSSSDVANLAVAAPMHDGSFLGIFLHADFTVQIVMALLLFASFWSWAIIFDKWITFRSIQRKAAKFEADFWASEALDKFHERIKKRANHPMAIIFTAGMEEWFRGKIRDLSHANLSQKLGVRERINQIMMVSRNREIEKLENGLGFLATVGSSAPFIGLFGTVLGIMHSFSAIANTKNTSLVAVAPGIAEALFATAIGLFAAIPAVIAYNKFSNELDKFSGKLEDFSVEFNTLLSRQIEG